MILITSSPSNGTSTTYENQYMSFNKSSNWIINSTDGGIMNGIYDSTIPTKGGNPSIAGSIQVLNSASGGVNDVLQEAKSDNADISKKTINGNTVYLFTDPVYDSWNAIWPEGNDTGLYLTISTTSNKNDFDTIVNSMTLKNKAPN